MPNLNKITYTIKGKKSKHFKDSSVLGVIFWSTKYFNFEKGQFLKRPTMKSRSTEWVVREGVGAGGRNDPSLVCTYE
jgi:hypothetical protein